MREIRYEAVTWFRAETIIDTFPAIVTEGFAKADRTWKATATFTDPAEPDQPDGVMHALSDVNASWMQMEEWSGDQAGCWLAMSPKEVPLGIQALNRREPTYISVLPLLGAVGYTPDSSRGSIEATLRLDAAMTLFLAQLVHEADVTQADAADAEVPVVVRVDSGHLVDLRVAGADVLAALEQTDATVGDKARQALESMRVLVAYPESTAPAKVSPPPADLIMQKGDEGCRAEGS